MVLDLMEKDSFFLHRSDEPGKNLISFGVDINLSTRIDNRKKYTKDYNFHYLQKKCVQVTLQSTILKICLSLHYNGANSYLFVNGAEIYKFKAKDSEIVATPLCLGNISKNFSVNNMKKTGLNGYVYDFSIDYDATTFTRI